MGGDRYFEIELKTGEIEQFVPLFEKYNQWMDAAADSHLPEGVEKELGKIGKESCNFITPDKLKLGRFIMEVQDVQLLVDAICGVSQMKQDVLANISKANAASKAEADKALQQAEAAKQVQEKANSVLR